MWGGGAYCSPGSGIPVAYQVISKVTEQSSVANSLRFPRLPTALVFHFQCAIRKNQNKNIRRVLQLTAVFIEIIYMYVEKGQKTMTILFGILL